MFKQFGVGLATAILLDATIVRGVLLPASMKLLGDWNWYLPQLARVAPALRRVRARAAGRAQADPRLRLDRHDPHRPPGRTGPGVSPAKGTPQMTAATPRQKPLTRSRIVALAIIGLAVLGLAYLRFAPDAGPVSVPKGAHAGDLILESCTYATEDGGYERRLRDARRAREPGRPGVAADRAAGDPDPRPVGAPGRADLPARGRPRHHQHAVQEREPVRRRPRRRPRRLPRHGRLGPARLPRGRVGAEALDGPPRRDVLPRSAPTRSAPARIG